MDDFDKLLSQPSTTDLFGQPSTEQVLMGARARGQSSATRDPRAVPLDDICFDTDFDPDAPSTSSSSKPSAQVSSSGVLQAASTGIDVVDQDELKRRIRGSGSSPPALDRLKLQAYEVGAKVKASLIPHINAHPRIALGIVAILVLLAMYWSIWLIATREEAAVESRHSTSRPPHPDVVSVAAAGIDTGSAGSSDSGNDGGDGESSDVQVASSKSFDSKDSLVATLTRSNKDVKAELARLRKDVQEVKELLKTSLRQASTGSSVRKQAPKRTAAPTTPEPTTPAPEQEEAVDTPVVEEDGEGEVRTEVRAESKAQPESTTPASEAAAEPANDPGEIRIEKPRSRPTSPKGQSPAARQESSSQSADRAAATPSGGWGQFFAR